MTVTLVYTSLTEYTGVLGLVTVKNLAEEGFNVTGFDRNGYVGGLWHFSPSDQVSILPSKNRMMQYTMSLLTCIATVVNISKQRVRDFRRRRDHC